MVKPSTCYYSTAAAVESWERTKEKVGTATNSWQSAAAAMCCRSFLAGMSSVAGRREWHSVGGPSKTEKNAESSYLVSSHWKQESPFPYDMLNKCCLYFYNINSSFRNLYWYEARDIAWSISAFPSFSRSIEVKYQVLCIIYSKYDDFTKNWKTFEKSTEK